MSLDVGSICSNPRSNVGRESQDQLNEGAEYRPSNARRKGLHVVHSVTGLEMTFRVIKIMPVSDRYKGLLEEHVQGAKSIPLDDREIFVEAKQLDVPSNEPRPSVPRQDSHNRAPSKLGINEPLVHRIRKDHDLH